MTIPVIRTVAELRATVRRWRREQATIAAVPTMGALHEGHLSLVRNALDRADHTIVTIFVNPKQFSNTSDLAAYPRNEAADAVLLSRMGAIVLYVPSADEMYPTDFATTVSVDRVSKGLCGDFRPGHFEGVATIVTKLFLQTDADFAFFGEKDFQQLHVVRQLARDLDIPISVVACPTVREVDGLALSSRNVRLSTAERRIAPKLAEMLFGAARRLAQGAPVEDILAACTASVLREGYRAVEYIEVRGDDDLMPITERVDRPARLLVAAWLGETRLIDNVLIKPGTSATYG